MNKAVDFFFHFTLDNETDMTEGIPATFPFPVKFKPQSNTSDAPQNFIIHTGVENLVDAWWKNPESFIRHTMRKELCLPLQLLKFRLHQKSHAA